MAESTARLILLRRPAAVHLIDEPFVPRGEAGLLDEVAERWEALCEANPAFYDGRLLHVIGVHRNGWGGAVIHAAECAYRFHAVQDANFDLGVRPLGVKGITQHDGRVLLGRRGRNVAHYAGLWEFAPGGVVEPGRSPEQTVAAELHEETGLQPAHDPTPVAMIFDDVLRTWEMVFRIEVASGDGEPPTSEYSELRWCTRAELPERLSPVARQMVRLL